MMSVDKATLDELLSALVDEHPNQTSQDFLKALDRYKYFLKSLVSESVPVGCADTQQLSGLIPTLKLFSSVIESIPQVFEVDKKCFCLQKGCPDPITFSESADPSKKFCRESAQDSSDLYISFLLSKFAPLLCVCEEEVQKLTRKLYISLLCLARVYYPLYYSYMVEQYCQQLLDLVTVASKFTATTFDSTAQGEVVFSWRLGEDRLLNLSEYASYLCLLSNLLVILRRTLEPTGAYIAGTHYHFYYVVIALVDLPLPTSLQLLSVHRAAWALLLVLLEHFGCELQPAFSVLFGGVLDYLSDLICVDDESIHMQLSALLEKLLKHPLLLRCSYSIFFKVSKALSAVLKYSKTNNLKEHICSIAFNIAKFIKDRKFIAQVVYLFWAYAYEDFLAEQLIQLITRYASVAWISLNAPSEYPGLSILTSDSEPLCIQVVNLGTLLLERLKIPTVTGAPVLSERTFSDFKVLGLIACASLRVIVEQGIVEQKWTEKIVVFITSTIEFWLSALAVHGRVNKQLLNIIMGAISKFPCVSYKEGLISSKTLDSLGCILGWIWLSNHFLPLFQCKHSDEASLLMVASSALYRAEELLSSVLREATKFEWPSVRVKALFSVAEHEQTQIFSCPFSIDLKHKCVFGLGLLPDHFVNIKIFIINSFLLDLVSLESHKEYTCKDGSFSLEGLFHLLHPTSTFTQRMEFISRIIRSLCYCLGLDWCACPVLELFCGLPCFLFAKHDSAAEACLCRAKKTSQDSSVCSESAHAVVDLAGLIIHAATSDTSILLLTGEHAKRLFILFLDTLFRHLTIHDVFTLDAGLARHIITTCTTLLRDSSPRVRYLMGNKLGILVHNEWHQAAVDLDRITSPENTFLVETLNCLAEGDTHITIELRETLIIALSSVAKVAEGKLLALSLVSIAQLLTSENSKLRALSFDQLQEVASERGVSVSTLLLPAMDGLAAMLVDCLAKGEGTLQIYVELLDCKNVGDLLKKTMKFTLPYMVRGKLTTVLVEAARLVEQEDVPELLVENMHYILEFIFMKKISDTEVADIMNFITQQLNNHSNKDTRRATVRDLLNCQLRNLLKLLFLRKKEEVRWVFDYLCSSLSTDGKLSTFLRDHLLAIMAFFNAQLLHTTLSAHEKQKVLNGLISLMEMISPEHLYGIRAKATAILRLAMQSCPLSRTALQGWAILIRKLPANHLGPMLSNLVYVTLGLVDAFPQEVVAILRYLIVENAEFYPEYLRNIYFLPELPCLQELNAYLRQHLPARPFQQELGDLVEENRGITNESLTVRIAALRHLKSLLHQHVDELSYLVRDDKTTHLVSTAVKRLFDSTFEKDKTARLLVAECLGELGAIDPAKLSDSAPCDRRMRLKSSPECTSSPLEEALENAVEFAMRLISDFLVPSFLAAEDTQKQDRAAYVIQEFLRFCAFNPELPLEGPVDESVSSVNWMKFSKGVREIIHPYLKSEYGFTGSKKAAIPGVVFRVGLSFDQWISAWTVGLISLVTGRFQAILDPCKTVVKDDVTLAIHLLPHAVLNILLQKDEALADQVLNEVNTVLTAAEACATLPDIVYKSSLTVFSMIDQLTHWLRLKLTANFKLLETDEALRGVHSFLKGIPNKLLADVAFRCNAFDRALYYFESFLRLERKTSSESTTTAELFDQHLAFLHKIYGSIGSAEAMAGVSAIRLSYNVNDEILDLEAANRWSYALSFYSKEAFDNPNALSARKGLLRCHINLSNYETIISYVNDVEVRQPELLGALNHFRVHAAWRLGDWSALERSLAAPCCDSFEVDVGRILMAARLQEHDAFNKELCNARSKIIQTLSAIAMETGRYERAYGSVVHLHILQGIESVASKLLFLEPKSLMREINNNWKKLELTKRSFEVRESLLTVHRALLQLVLLRFSTTSSLASDINTEVAENLTNLCDGQLAKSWIQNMKLARKAGAYETAFKCSLHKEFLVSGSVGDEDELELELEKAKLLWSQGYQNDALLELLQFQRRSQTDTLNVSDSTEPCSNSMPGTIEPREPAVCCDHKQANEMRMQLLVAKWMVQTGHYQNHVIDQFKEVISQKSFLNEKVWFRFGKYYDSMGEPYVLHVVENFGRSLLYGIKYLFQTLPRLLTLWLDYTKGFPKSQENMKANSSDGAQKELYERDVNSLNAYMKKWVKQIPPFIFYTAFSQLLSRICHTNSKVYQIIESIILKVLISYPDQGLWAISHMSVSSIPIRQTRCTAILNKLCLRDSGLSELVKEHKSLRLLLVELCNRSIAKNESKISIEKDFRKLLRITPLRVIIPLQRFLIGTLPPPTSSDFKEHHPFPLSPPRIFSFKDSVEVLNSLQRPKKITVIGDDGMEYVFLCKPKDDLRKDQRIMEFFSTVNTILNKYSESRLRCLRIRTYAVVVLNEECGMLEWVHHTERLRQILNNIYESRDATFTSRVRKEIKTYFSLKSEQRLSVTTMLPFLTNLIKLHYPALFEWFLLKFPDPSTWYASRVAYTNSVSLMSMVGYVVGLGDRHGENLLVDSTTGECVHVDFNCLFEKGKTLPLPERVPFRLTHNMIDALGITGYEGLFRKTCQLTLKVLRNEKSSLVNMLAPFVYDPVGDCDSSKIIKTVENKLQGKLADNGLPLSTEGQVHRLIQEATDLRNLCIMYIGWAAYM